MALYSRALSQLNLQHDPAGALGTLNAYRFQHPDGFFRGEAIIAQIEAELLLGRDAEVLALLDALHADAFAGMPQARELGLVRAELLALAGRCAEAMKVLVPYLDPSLPAEEHERALLLQASCRAKPEGRTHL